MVGFVVGSNVSPSTVGFCVTGATLGATLGLSVGLFVGLKLGLDDGESDTDGWPTGLGLG